MKQLRCKYNIYTSVPILRKPANSPYEIINTIKEFEWFNNDKVKPKMYQSIQQAISITFKLIGTRDHTLSVELRNKRSNLPYKELTIVKILRNMMNYCDKRWIRNLFGVKYLFILNTLFKLKNFFNSIFFFVFLYRCFCPQ